MKRFMSSLSAFVCFRACLLALGLVTAAYVSAQPNDVDQIAKAQEAISNKNWTVAETILTPLIKSQPKNPFVFYNLAQVYENTNRLDSAKQIYQGLTNTLSTDGNQYTVVVRAPYANRLVSLVSLAQAKLNAITAKQAAPTLAAIASAPLVANAPTAARVPAKDKDNYAAVIAAMKGWATAWANKNMSNYYMSYVDGFQGKFPTRTDWKRQREKNITQAKNIAINFSNVQIVTLAPGRTQVQFIQNYISDRIQDTSKKTMVFVQKNDKWLIERELIE